jgi:hypothetical protein
LTTAPFTGAGVAEAAGGAAPPPRMMVVPAEAGLATFPWAAGGAGAGVGAAPPPRSIVVPADAVSVPVAAAAESEDVVEAPATTAPAWSGVNVVVVDDRVCVWPAASTETVTVTVATPVLFGSVDVEFAPVPSIPPWAPVASMRASAVLLLVHPMVTPAWSTSGRAKHWRVAGQF